jgi:hypothetical protein
MVTEPTRWRALELAIVLAALGGCGSGHTCSGPGGLCIEPRAPDVGNGDANQTAGGEGGDGTTPGTALAGDAGTSSGGASMAGAPSGETGSGVDTPEEDACEVRIPVAPELVISSVFYPAGYGERDWVELLGLAACSGERVPGARGDCYAFEWTPYALPAVEVSWINDDAWSPVCLEPGADRLSFWARGEHEGQLASFGFALPWIQIDVELSTAWKRFEIPLTGLDYDGHIDAQDELVKPGLNAGFWMQLAHPEQGLQRVFVDDIRLTPPVVQCQLPSDVASGCAATNPPAAEASSWCDPNPGPGEPEPDVDAPSLLIDDLEDGNDLSLPLPGGRGTWQTFDDGSPGAAHLPAAKCVLPSKPKDSSGRSGYAMRSAGCGFRNWGAGIQLAFGTQPPDCKTAFDASSYDGLAFWLYGEQSSPPIMLQLNTSRTVPVEQGGDCVEDCFNAYQKVLAPSIGWNQVRVPFVELQQTHAPTLLNPATLRSIAWLVPPVASFDFAIDDLELYRE